MNSVRASQKQILVARLLSLVALLFFISSAQAELGNITPVHDPCIAKCGDTYYIYSTGKGLYIRTSKDLIHWERAGYVFSPIPAWCRQEVPDYKDLWAPDLSFFNGEWHLYYAVSSFGSNRSVVGFATNKTLDLHSPNYKWVDQGKAVETHYSDNYNAIDPNIFVEKDGSVWLIYGSYWSGIKMCQLDAKTGKPASSNPPLISLASRPPDGPIEGSFLIKHDGYYYLFVSFDYCCRGSSSDYKTMVGRSKSLTGPYVDMQGTPMMQGGGTLVLASQNTERGPGHNGILIDGNKTYIVHHYYDATDWGRSKFHVRPIIWDSNGWPMPGEPVSAIREKSTDITGDWVRSAEFREEKNFRILPNGHIDDPNGPNTWRRSGNTLTLKFPSKDAPGGAWIDTVTVTSDNNSFVGRNQIGELIRGHRKS